MKVSKKESSFLVYLFIIISLVVVFLILYYVALTNKNKSPSLSPQGKRSSAPPPTQQRYVAVRKAEELPQTTVIPTTGEKVIVIPLTFVVKSISPDTIILQKEGGGEREIVEYLPKKQTIKVFSGTPENSQLLGGVEKLALGQKIKVINHITKKEIYFYIIK